MNGIIDFGNVRKNIQLSNHCSNKHKDDESMAI